jgi:hypothetical protein
MLTGPAEPAIEKEYEALEPVTKLGKWFERKYGSINCGDIRRAHMGTELDRLVPWQKQWAEDLGMHDFCSRLVGKTARRAAALLANPDLSIVDEV